MWHERVHVRLGGIFIFTKTIRYCVPRRHHRRIGKAYVIDFPYSLSNLVWPPVEETISQRIASYLLIAVTTAITFIALWYIYRELNRVKPAVIYERRKARYIHPILFPIRLGP
jgi:hypothetical protein